VKIVALLAILALYAVPSTNVGAQGFRGFVAGSGTSSGAGQSGTTVSPTRSGSPGSAPSAPARGPANTPGPGLSIERAPQAAVPQVAVPRFVPPVVHGGVTIVPGGTPGSVTAQPAPKQGFAPPPNGQIQRIPTVQSPRVGSPTVYGGGFAKVPPKPVHPPAHRPHRPPRPTYPIYPGIIILDSPYYFPNTVITEVAPGVIREERRYADDTPAESHTRSGGQLAPFDPTPPEVVERMLRLAAVKKGDLLYDLGAGDGRVAIAAAKKYGIKAVGFEIDPGLVKLARENVRRQGVEHLVEIREQDFLTADLTLPTVVTLYLSYDGNLTVRPLLVSQLKAGARVVSYTFDMAEWQPKATESYRDIDGNNHMIYLWEIGGPLVFGDVRW